MLLQALVVLYGFMSDMERLAPATERFEHPASGVVFSYSADLKSVLIRKPGSGEDVPGTAVLAFIEHLRDGLLAGSSRVRRKLLAASANDSCGDYIRELLDKICPEDGSGGCAHRDPWANVALVTFNHPGVLSRAAYERIGVHFERAIRPHTSAPVIVCEEGAEVQLHGEGEDGRPIGVLAVPLLTPEEQELVTAIRGRLSEHRGRVLDWTQPSACADLHAVLDILDRIAPRGEEPA